MWNVVLLTKSSLIFNPDGTMDKPLIRIYRIKIFKARFVKYTKYIHIWNLFKTLILTLDYNFSNLDDTYRYFLQISNPVFLFEAI